MTAAATTHARCVKQGQTRKAAAIDDATATAGKKGAPRAPNAPDRRCTRQHNRPCRAPRPSPTQLPAAGSSIGYGTRPLQLVKSTTEGRRIRTALKPFSDPCRGRGLRWAANACCRPISMLFCLSIPHSLSLPKRPFVCLAMARLASSRQWLGGRTVVRHRPRRGLVALVPQARMNRGGWEDAERPGGFEKGGLPPSAALRG